MEKCIAAVRVCTSSFLAFSVSLNHNDMNHSLRTFSSSSSYEEGQIRLSEEDGPSFLTPDDYDDDNEHLTYTDTDSLSAHMKCVTNAWREPTIVPGLLGSEGQAVDSNSSAPDVPPTTAPATPLVKLNDTTSTSRS